MPRNNIRARVFRMSDFRQYMTRQAAVMARAARLYRIDVVGAVVALGGRYKARHWGGR